MLKPKYLIWLLVPFIGFIGSSIFSIFTDRYQKSSDNSISAPVERPIEAVAALGQLSPLGDVRRLAAPVSGFGGTPRVSQLFIREGDPVEEGQVLAVFDNRPQILADLEGLQARINTLEAKIRMQQREVTRYKEAAMQGASSLVLLEDHLKYKLTWTSN